MKSRTRSRKPASIGSNHSSRRPTAISPSEPRTGNFVLLLVMAWSPPAHNAGIVWVSAPGDYATFNSNHTPDGTNIFLHYALDLWVHQWRRRHASGRVSIVRYADDFVMGFEKAADARRMMVDLKARLAKFGLALHEDKTRLIEFGRLPALRRQQRGERRPETFAFLGFTHYCGGTRDGRFIVKHKTQSKRLTRKLTALRQEAWRHMHAPMAEQQRWYASILRGHYGYYGLPNNSRALSAFHQEVRRIWFRSLRQRSQKARSLTWDRFKAMLERFPLPP